MAALCLRLFLVFFASIVVVGTIVNIFIMEPIAAFTGMFYPAMWISAPTACAVAWLHAAFSRKIAGAGYGPEIYQTSQSAQLSVDLAFNKLFELSLRYLKEKPGFKILESAPASKRITAKSRITLKSVGNIITFEFTENSPVLTGLKISSRPRFAITLTDYGENLQIVRDAKNYILQQK